VPAAARHLPDDLPREATDLPVLIGRLLFE
jgi:hypothetical protein